MQPEQIRVAILVKAAPVLTSQLEETMCVAGIRIDREYEWVRLHPVPFRDLEDERRFAKYQVVTVDVIRPRGDRRPESWVPIHGTIDVHDRLGTTNGWAPRRAIVSELDEANMCDLVERNRTGSGPGTPSLAIVRPLEPPKLLVTKREAAQLEEWRHRAKAAAASPSLFDDPANPKPELDVVPWRFRYDYRCCASGCRGHKQTIVDWEIVALWRRVRHRDNWEELLRDRFERELWSGRDSVLFVGNQEQHPQSFLVLGVFWPPSGPVQRVLDI